MAVENDPLLTWQNIFSLASFAVACGALYWAGRADNRAARASEIAEKAETRAENATRQAYRLEVTKACADIMGLTLDAMVKVKQRKKDIRAGLSKFPVAEAILDHEENSPSYKEAMEAYKKINDQMKGFRKSAEIENYDAADEKDLVELHNILGAIRPVGPVIDDLYESWRSTVEK